MLSRLSAVEYGRLKPHLKCVSLSFGQTIYHPKAEIDYVYFPETSVISIVGLTDNHRPIEVGLVGSEGFTGVPLFLGVACSPNEVIVQGEGTAQRISAQAALAEFKRGGAFHDSILLFAHELFLQLARVTSCNRHHEVGPRLARWLLMMHDRVKGERLLLTQEFLAWMLGVRNQAVSRAAMLLQEDEAIRYSRGAITIVNRAKLEHRACPCYGLVKLPANSFHATPPDGNGYSSWRTDKER